MASLDDEVRVSHMCMGGGLLEGRTSGPGMAIVNFARIGACVKAGLPDDTYYPDQQNGSQRK